MNTYLPLGGIDEKERASRLQTSFGAVEVKPLGRIQKISGPRLHASWVNVPHVWQMDEADITELEATRNQLKNEAAARNIKLTPLAFIIRAVAKALKEFPALNASLDAAAQNLVLKKYVHVGFAADTPNGLVVPVIRNADQKDVYELAQDLATLSEKARDGKLSGKCMGALRLAGPFNLLKASQIFAFIARKTFGAK